MEKKDTDKPKIWYYDPEWVAPSLKELKSIITLSDFNKKDVLNIFGITLKLVNRKKELNNFEILYKTCILLPCTVSVLSRKLKKSKPTMYSKLNQLLDWGIIEKKIDVESDFFKYYLKDEFAQGALELRNQILNRLKITVKDITPHKKAKLRKIFPKNDPEILNEPNEKDPHCHIETFTPSISNSKSQVRQFLDYQDKKVLEIERERAKKPKSKKKFTTKHGILEHDYWKPTEATKKDIGIKD